MGNGKYTKYIRGILPLILLVLVIILTQLMTVPSIARYENVSDGRMKIKVAGWNFQLNGNNVIGTDSNMSDAIKLVPTTNISPTNPNLILPGQSGYFDVTIDPTGTGVAFTYKVRVNETKSNLPSNFKIVGYSFQKGDTYRSLPDNKIIRGDVLLNGMDYFSEDDIINIRYFWEYTTSGSAIADVYEVCVDIDLKQYGWWWEDEE